MLAAVSALPINPRNEEFVSAPPAVFALLALAPDSFNLQEEVYEAQKDIIEEHVTNSAPNEIHIKAVA